MWSSQATWEFCTFCPSLHKENTRSKPVVVPLKRLHLCITELPSDDRTTKGIDLQPGTCNVGPVHQSAKTISPTASRDFIRLSGGHSPWGDVHMLRPLRPHGTFQGLLVLVLSVVALDPNRAQSDEAHTASDGRAPSSPLFQKPRQTLNHCIPNTGLGIKGAYVACPVNPESPKEGEFYVRTNSTAHTTCYNPYALPETRPPDERHAVRCFSPRLGLGHSPGGHACTGTYAQAVIACARLSVIHLTGAPNHTEYPVTDWRLARNNAEVGEVCGSGCNSDGQPMW
eukprot:CAMPEP_0118922828 /NCGR_PEP_ID=MMETSP1169-20130426/1611_1 /TAXON_ID=36882 /ORGANISM="Pyramimonas obovata, Strain CCMP722" /LENGTH=283 /DNA_ID=CAMNT_0006863753 /DNA_START=47 /DNA_END=896 /DNA_ORIENTATION=+